jgi:hypothetical protein
MRTAPALAAPLLALAALADAEPAVATPRPTWREASASDTDRAPAVHVSAPKDSGRPYCTPAACTGAGASPMGSALGFAATTLAAAAISRRRTPASS